MNIVKGYDRHKDFFIVLHTTSGEDICLPFDEALILFQDLNIYYEFGRLCEKGSLTVDQHIDACHSTWRPVRKPLFPLEENPTSLLPPGSRE